MSLIKGIDHSRVINFLQCEEGTGNTTVALTGQSLTSATAITWNTNPNEAEFVGTDNNKALDAGAWQEPGAGMDFILLTHIGLDGTIAVFTIGNSTGQRFNWQNGANFAVVGASGSATVTDLFTNGVKFRHLAIYESGVNLRQYKAVSGSPLLASSLATASADPGDITTMADDFTANTLTGQVNLAGLMMVTFPDGLPSDADLIARANDVFTSWEAGSKVAWPAYTDGGFALPAA